MITISFSILGLISAHVGESQRERRRFFLAALRDLGMGKSRLVENITAEIDNLCDAFASQHGGPFSPFYDITVPVSNVISWIVFGKRFHRDDPTYKGFVKIVREGIEICETTGIVGFIPILEYLPLPVWRKLAGNDIKGRELLQGDDWWGQLQAELRGAVLGATLFCRIKADEWD